MMQMSGSLFYTDEGS